MAALQGFLTRRKTPGRTVAVSPLALTQTHEIDNTSKQEEVQRSI